MGQSSAEDLLIVVYTLRGEIVRLISAGELRYERERPMRHEYDFSNAKRAKDVPHLAKLQQTMRGKTRITIMLDDDVIEAFRQRAEVAGSGYQTEINRAPTATIG